MIARKFFEYVCFALLVSVFQNVCCLEFRLSICSESHAKAEYTLQDPVKCKPHVPPLTKQCDIRIFKKENFLYNIPAIDSAKSECLKSDAICGFSQFVILPYNCQLKKQPLVRRAKPRQHSSKLYAAYLQDLEDNLIDSIKRLEASHNYLQCKI